MKRKGIIISIIGIIIVALSLLGITFGYYYTRIFGNENATSVKVTSAMKAIKYIELSEEVSGTVIKPGYEYIKTFAATSLSTEEEIYHIYLDEVINEFTRTQDITYTLYRKSGNNTIDTSNLSDCEEISSGIFPKTNSYIKFNEKLLTKGDSYTYALKINYLDSSEEQDIDDGKTFGFKVQIHSEFQNPYNSDTTLLAYNIINGAVTKQNGTELIVSSNKFTGISGANEKTLSMAPDDYGTSYYYRGAVKDNYVKFAGFTWRIVRINGDGSIRLILDGTLDKVKREGSDAFAGSTSEFNSLYNDNAYVGYMYGLAASTTDTNRCLKLNGTTVKDVISTYGTKETCEANNGTWTTTAYEATHANIADSTIKTAVDTFYETYIENNTNNYHYEKYLADTLFCGDKTLANSSIGSSNTALGYGTNKTYYAATERLGYSTGTTEVTTATPTLECAKGASNTYSRYTSNSTTTTKGVSVNSDLKHPIGLLSADELVMAGAWKSTINKTYYLYDAYADGNLKPVWWTMSPSNFYGYTANELDGNSAGSSLVINGNVDNTNGSRLAVNLKSDSLIASGDGTKERPYVLKEIS